MQGQQQLIWIQRLMLCWNSFRVVSFLSCACCACHRAFLLCHWFEASSPGSKLAFVLLAGQDKMAVKRVNSAAYWDAEQWDPDRRADLWSRIGEMQSEYDELCWIIATLCIDILGGIKHCQDAWGVYVGAEAGMQNHMQAFAGLSILDGCFGHGSSKAAHFCKFTV